MLLWLACSCFTLTGWSQTTNISGQINDYAIVTQANMVANEFTLGVGSPAFALDDLVLIIQMQGATVSTSNNSTFGSITDLGTTGNMEIATVCDFTANVLSFQEQLVNTYDDPSTTDAVIQIVRVPQYVDANVNGTLSGQAWDGATGGILAFSASGTVTLNANLDMDGLGFRGPAHEESMFACVPSLNGTSAASNSVAFFYDQASGRAGKKGEGIAPYPTNQDYGQGALANGGGGGNEHQAGGGGGGHYLAGGNGGQKVNGIFNCFGLFEGIGGYALQTPVNNGKVFMGGGGGAGHDDDDDGADAGNGGGIILIIADQIDGNGFGISARGTDSEDALGDAASGGGAGGTVLLSVNGFSANPLTISVDGGDGGQAGVGSNCLGPGGGGAGGVIRTTTVFPANVTSSVAGGAAGVVNPAVAGCGGNTQGAAVGGNGIVLNTFSLAAGTTTLPCVLGWEENPWQEENEDLDPSFKAYPNPVVSGERVHIEWDQPEAGRVKLAFYNAVGQEVWANEGLLDAGPQQVSVDLSHLPSGLYLLRKSFRGQYHPLTIQLGN